MALAILGLSSNSQLLIPGSFAAGLFAFVLAFALCILSMVELWHISTMDYRTMTIRRSRWFFYAKLGLLVFGVAAIGIGLTD